MADNVVPATGANLVIETEGNPTLNAITGGTGRRAYPTRMVWGDFGTFNAPTLAGGIPTQFDTATAALFGTLADVAASDGTEVNKGIIPLLKGAVAKLDATVNALTGTLTASGTFTEAPSAAVNFAKIDTAASGSSALVGAVSGKKIRVMSLNFIAGGDVSVSLLSAATALTGAYPLTAQAGLSATGGAYGVMETASGQALNINLSAAVQVSGVLSYIEV